MATTNRLYILSAFLFSAIAAIFNVVSLGTEYWVHGKTAWSDDDSKSFTDNTINYGLFQGNYKRSYPTPSIYQLSMTCDFGHGVCAMLCGESRFDILKSLYNDIKPNEAYNDCHMTSSYSTFFRVSVHALRESSSVDHKGFINPWAWLFTVIFVVLTSVMGFCASVLALYNTVSNPIYYFLSVRSLFFYNGAAFCSTVLYMVIWGVLYQVTIFHNVGNLDTLVNETNSDKTIYLGYSYWISLISLTFYCASIAVLFYREYLNARDPKQQKVDLDVNSSDPNLYLY